MGIVQDCFPLYHGALLKPEKATLQPRSTELASLFHLDSEGDFFNDRCCCLRLMVLM